MSFLLQLPHLPIDAAPYPQFTTTMHLSSTVLATCLVSASLVLARSSLRHRQSQGDGSQGDADGSQGDLGARPPAKFAYPVIDFPNPTETVVFESAYYVQPGEIFDGKMKRYERPEGSCNEQAEVSLQIAFQCPRARVSHIYQGNRRRHCVQSTAWIHAAERRHREASIGGCPRPRRRLGGECLVGGCLRRRSHEQGPQHAATGHWWWSP